MALTLLGLGLSGLIGEFFVGEPGVRLPKLYWFDILVPTSFILTAAVAWVLFRTKTGLIIRAVGDSHGSAHALGYRVIAVRFLCVLFGGACAGLAGGYLSLAYTPQWVENMTAGRGWIALALVVFASWRPWRVVAGAYLFGAISILRLRGADAGVGIPSQFLSSDALYCHDTRSCGDLGKPEADQDQHAGLPGPVLCAGQITTTGNGESG